MYENQKLAETIISMVKDGYEIHFSKNVSGFYLCTTVTKGIYNHSTLQDFDVIPRFIEPEELLVSMVDGSKNKLDTFIIESAGK